ncbi:MAG: DUF4861 domain-containing protein [Candidatus Neomarinimicrobiota bacterium]
MKPARILGLLISMVLLLSCAKKDTIDPQILEGYPDFIALSVSNQTDLAREEAAFVIPVLELKKRNADFNPEAFIVLAGGVELASQENDLNGDGQVDQIVCISDFKPGEKRQITVRYHRFGAKQRDYPRRTQAELSHKTGGYFEKHEYIGGAFTNVRFLRVPDEHTDHSYFIRYEGPGWESDRVGYRFYLDWRNAIDIFGKKVPDMVLQNVGQDGFDSYHEMADWGMDILKVGESLGIGSVGMWIGDRVERVSQTDSITCAIIATGPVQSIIRTSYYGWQAAGGRYDLVSELSIAAGSRLTRHEVTIVPNPDNLCTGIVKHPGAKVITEPDSGSEWTYLGTFGRQSLADDNLGMAIIFRRQDLLELTEDEHNLVVVLRPAAGKLTYYFLATWEQEPDGIRAEGEFIEYLDRLKREKSGPLEVVL